MYYLISKTHDNTDHVIYIYYFKKLFLSKKCANKYLQTLKAHAYPEHCIVNEQYRLQTCGLPMRRTEYWDKSWECIFVSRLTLKDFIANFTKFLCQYYGK